MTGPPEEAAASVDPARVGAVTEALRDWTQGDRSALDRLLPHVHAELRRLAGIHMSREQPGHTLQPTALVSEAFLRLVGLEGYHWQDRAHFFAVAATQMRRVLVDHARARDAQKRGGRLRVHLDDAGELRGVGSDPSAIDWLELEAALDALAKLDAQQARVVELRCFAGLSVPEVAEVLSVSPRTIKRDWAVGTAWLRSRLQPAR